jgi:hypothetical protein
MNFLGFLIDFIQLTAIAPAVQVGKLGKGSTFTVQLPLDITPRKSNGSIPLLKRFYPSLHQPK